MKAKIFALGGLEENGKNSYIIESDNTILIIDAGSKKFENSSLGIDSIINDSDYLYKNKEKVKGILVSHAHMDQIGGLKRMIYDLNEDIPIYGSDYTIDFLKKQFKFKNLNKLQHNQIITLGDFVVENFSLSHAVFGNLGFLIAKDKEAIVYTTDYNFNQSRKATVRTDIDKIIFLKKKYKINTLLTESISSSEAGTATGDTSFIAKFKRYAETTRGKLFISLYSTNVGGMINVISLAKTLNKKVVIIGRDLLTYVNLSKQFGYIDHVNDMFVKTNDIDKYDPNEVIVVVSGMFLEPFLTLAKLSKKHPITTIEEKDSVLIASPPYDEIEGDVQKILDTVARTHCRILEQRINVFSHAFREDIKMMINLFDPENIVPIKGEYRKLKEVEKIAEDLGYSLSQIHILSNGEVLNLDSEHPYISNNIEVHTKLLNEKENELIDPLLLRDREMLTDEGYVLVVFIVDYKTKKIIQSPEVYSGGLMSFDEDDDLLLKCIEIINKEIDACPPEELILKVKNKLKRFLNNKIGKSPLILTVKIEVK